jgi:hypothetical protein
MNLKKLLLLGLGMFLFMLVITNIDSASAETISFEDPVGTERTEEEHEVCGFELVEESFYDAEVIAVRRKLRVEPGEIFRVKIFIKNTGNMPWFSNESSCLGPRIFIGTDKERDRDSSLYADTLEGIDDTNWEGTNRIGLDQLRINPGQIASFTFWSQAGEEPDVLKEYFTPVLAGIQWLDDAQFSFELMIGNTGESAADLRKKMSYSSTSGSVLDINLDGEHLILVDLSDQWMSIYLDDLVVRDFPVSTGKAATPTPTGTTSILLKQELRVGHEWPHYIMPKFQMFRAGGYGLHALPSLGGDGGWFWTEARNHIGIPVSHGCIRLLPEDADWLFDFSEVGDTVIVQW